MIIVSKRDILLLGFLTVLTVLVLGVIGYRFFLHPELASQLGFKLTAERFLFIAVVVATILALFYGAALMRSRNVSREIEKMIEHTGSDDYKPEVSLRKLGRLGRQISRLYTRLNELNRKLVLRIGAQSSLIGFLVGNMNQPILITDILGRIQYISKGYVEKKKASRSELLSDFVENLSADIVTQSILSKAANSHAAVDVYLEKEKEQITVHPVYNRDGDVSYLVFDFSHEHFFSREALVPETKDAEGGRQHRPKRDSFFGGIGAIFRRNGKKS
ncbi:hypothetical protein [Sediminispirochaeta smaragdinae]|jgi:hypothetical protein|uniref:Uncharacterized protein n=1 Tax=Sediminispirochaeta smaragdinae (strain DSM 11293 / JCM 15392 / SEBR 4228) TaxID=573413 RepID=E1R992_SEDSS|nr:hypothetical protein [Sediminispirochaeta smaragdinae]ADK83061.1 hypothetical protein Spirs_3976 [Sediminispirochaeta smaragdinae DSM 11293]